MCCFENVDLICFLYTDKHIYKPKYVKYIWNGPEITSQVKRGANILTS